MEYTIIDLLDKIISLEEHVHEIYNGLANKDIDIKLKTVARVFAQEEKRHANKYRAIKERIDKEKNIGIDFNLYDKASNLISEFKRSINEPKVENINQILEFMLKIEKENVALVIRIRDILITNLNEKDNTIYKVLGQLLVEEQKHVENLEQFLKR